MTPVRADVQLKHEIMRGGRFPFFRATFYRWAQLWPCLPATIRDAPAVCGIGDAHGENFGTWRDREGRLIWGGNDFDEAAVPPFTHDLVRPAVSALSAKRQGSLQTRDGSMLEASLVGYSAGLKHGGAPFVLEDRKRAAGLSPAKSRRAHPRHGRGLAIFRSGQIERTGRGYGATLSVVRTRICGLPRNGGSGVWRSMIPRLKLR